MVPAEKLGDIPVEVYMMDCETSEFRFCTPRFSSSVDRASSWAPASVSLDTTGMLSAFRDISSACVF